MCGGKEMNRSYRLSIEWIVCVCLAIAIEIIFQRYRKIYGIGIITLIYFSVLIIHDMFLVKEKRK